MTLSAPIPDDGIGLQDSTSTPAEGSGLSLLRLGLWTDEMRLKMKMMAQVVDDAKCEDLSRTECRRGSLTVQQIMVERWSPRYINIQVMAIL